MLAAVRAWAHSDGVSVVAETDRVALFRGSDDAWARRIVAGCPSLSLGVDPPRWARSAHTQTVLTVLFDDRAPTLAWEDDERLVVDDGGTLSLQWSGLQEPPETPVLVVLHTICGSGHSLRRFIAAMRRDLGWVVVACNRRGHADLPLTAPRINTMGFVDDLDAQLDRILARRPGAPLFAAGISAGSGLLVRYLGEKREASRFDAAVAVCPAYDVPEGLRAAHPRYDAYMTRKMVRFFLERNRDVLGPVDGFSDCVQARTMVEFHDRLYPLAGFDSVEAYREASDPMRVAPDVTTPTLVLNAEDDPVCSVSNVHRHRDAMQNVPRILTALTRFGGHCGFFEAARPDSCWSDRAIAEFLLAAHVNGDG